MKKQQVITIHEGLGLDDVSNLVMCIVYSVVWLHDTLCEVAVTDEPGRGNYVPSGVPDVVILYGANELWNQFHLLVQDLTALFISFQGDRRV